MNRQQKILLASAIISLTVVSLLTWNYMPIYPDEIAFRLINCHEIQNQGISQRLFPLCASNVKPTPLIFVFPAWLLSLLNLNLNSIEMRIFPICITLSAIILTLLFSLKSQYPKVAILVVSSLIGVAGSALVMVRPDFLQVFNFMCCLATIYYIESNSKKKAIRYFIIVLLFISSLFAIYSHPQGLIFLPLTLYTIFRILNPKFKNFISAIFLIMLFILISKSTIDFQNFSCPEYPEINAFFSEKVLTYEKLRTIKISDFFIENIKKYTYAFGYNKNYPINYLPGLNPKKAWLLPVVNSFNICINLILIINLILFFFIFIKATYSFLTNVFKFKKNNTVNIIEDSISIILLTSPVLFLFVYDIEKNFYRSIFINLLISISVTIFFKKIYSIRFERFFNFYVYFCLIIASVSLCGSIGWFRSKFVSGFEGPSIKIQENWAGIDEDIAALVNDCDVDLSKGGIVIDDMTYNSLKSYKNLYPITYLHLSGVLIKSNTTEIIKKVHPNYVIARVNYMKGSGIEIQKIRNKIGCTNLLKIDKKNAK